MKSAVHSRYTFLHHVARGANKLVSLRYKWVSDKQNMGSHHHSCIKALQMIEKSTERKQIRLFHPFSAHNSLTPHMMSDDHDERSSSSAGDTIDAFIAMYDSSQSSRSDTAGAADALIAEYESSQSSQSSDRVCNNGQEVVDALCEELSITRSDSSEQSGRSTPPRAQTPEAIPYPDDSIAVSPPRQRATPQRRSALLSPPAAITPCKNDNEMRARAGLPPLYEDDEIPKYEHHEIDIQVSDTDSVGRRRTAEERRTYKSANRVRKWLENIAFSLE